MQQFIVIEESLFKINPQQTTQIDKLNNYLPYSFAPNINMILDPSDPTGLGLFSRCARNQACKTTKSRPQTATSKKSSNSPQIHEARRQKTLNQNYFAKQQSRQQRQRKFKRQLTPSVGQYNNLILKPKPKLVWDVIKLYHKQNKQAKQLQQFKQNIKNHKHSRNYHHRSLDFEGMDKNNDNAQNGSDNNRQTFETTNKSPNNKKSNTIITQPQYNSNQLAKSFNERKSTLNDKLYSSMQYHSRQNSGVSYDWNEKKNVPLMRTDLCMVDMSRTTGRDFQKQQKRQYSSVLSGTIDNQNKMTLTDGNTTFPEQSSSQIQLHKSVQKIKPRTKPNYYFKKMLGRKDQHNKATNGNIYNCNIDFVRPKQSALLNFGIVKGRDDPSERKRHEKNSYSYSHYDYNQYVWKSTSSVFPKTKKNLIPFDKQR